MDEINKHIIIVDDDELVHETLRNHLEQHAYEVTCVGTGAELIAHLQTNSTDTILLDLGLPDTDGLDLISEIRKITNAPIIVITGKGGHIDTVVGLEMGADDYLSKPFKPRELSARIKSVLRRYDPGPAPHSMRAASTGNKKIAFADWVLDCDAMQVIDADGEALGLTTKEFQLLEAFVESPGRVLSRAILFEMLRQDDYDSYDRAIDVQIARIRKKLKDDAQCPKIIKTIRGVGYMLICDTRPIPSSDADIAI